MLAFMTLNAGNLTQLIAIAQSAKQSDLAKFSQNISKFKPQNKKLDFNINARYTFSKKNEGYTPKAGSTLFKFKYLLFDGGEREKLEKIALKNNANEILKSQMYKNLISLQIGKVYFNALAMNSLIIIKEKEKLSYENMLDELEFYLEFGEISQEEFDAIKDKIKSTSKELDELYALQNELIAKTSVLSDMDIKFMAGSKVFMPDFSKKLSNLALKENEAFIKEQKIHKNEILPKVYLKDSQSISNANIEKFNSSDIIKANKIGLELKWDLPHGFKKSTQKQKDEVAYQKALLDLNDEQKASLAKLDRLESEILKLDAELKIKQAKFDITQKRVANLPKFYLSGANNFSEFLFLMSDNIAWLVSKVYDTDELELKKLEYFYEQGQDILNFITDEGGEF